MLIKPSRILDEYQIAIFYPEDKEYRFLQPLFKVYGLAVTDARSTIVYVDGGAFDEYNLDNDHLIAIDAHEMAHIILGHGVKEPNSIEEMEADYFAILILNAMNYGDAARLLIDDFSERHGMLYEEAEERLDTHTYNMIFQFMSRFFPDVDVINESDRLTKEFFETIAAKKLFKSKQRLVEGRKEDALKVAAENGVGTIMINRAIDASEKISPNHKYLLWIINQLIKTKMVDERKFETDIVEPLTYFHAHNNRFGNRDINAYQTLEDFNAAVKEAKSKERRSFIEQAPGDLIYENDKIQIMCPTTHAASCYYGSGTKWCTAATNDYHYQNYRRLGELYYVLDKTKPSDERTYKMAIRFKFSQGETGYQIAEIRDAPDDRILPLEEFLSYIGDEGYRAIINDLLTRREQDIEMYSFSKLKAKFDENPTEVLNNQSYNVLRSFLMPNGLIKNGVDLCKLLVEHGIHPLSKTDITYIDYYDYLLIKYNDINQAKVKFVNDFSEFHNEQYPAALLMDLFKFDDVITYFKLNNPDTFYRQFGETLMYWFDQFGDDEAKALFSSYHKSDAINWKEFWNEWGGLSGLVNYMKEQHQAYYNYILGIKGYRHNYFELKWLLKSLFQSNYSIIDIYSELVALNNSEIDLPIFKIISPNDWFFGFSELYGDNGVKELIPFLLKNNIDIFNYLPIESLTSYYGLDVMNAAIQYYEDDLASLLNFLGNKIELKYQIEYFEKHKEEDNDATSALLKLYGDEFFDHWTINALEIASGYDIESLEKIFTLNDLSDLFFDNVSKLRLYSFYSERIQDKELTEGEKLEYRKKAFNIAPTNDVRLNADGTVDLVTDGWEDFVDWFYDGESGYSRANPYYVAKALLQQGDDAWEPCYDLVQNWIDDVWDSTNAENIKYVREYIKTTILPVDIYPSEMRNWDEDEYADELKDGYFVLTPERLDKLSDGELGDIINEHDDFDDLKNEMRWAYENAYNDAIRDEWYKSYTDAIIDVVGSENPRWEKTGKVKIFNQGTDHEYKSDIQVFVLPNIKFFFLINEWADSNKEYENEFQYSSFIETVENLLSENNDLLTPNPSEWPNSNTVEEYYNEGVKGRI